MTADRSIAVLAFENMSPDPENEYFADGIAEEIFNVLARFEGLRVIARASAFSFKDYEETVAEIAEKLGVGYVLEGSVRKSGDRVRVTAQLIEAGSQSHVWSETCDRDLVEIFAVQDRIARAIADEL
jgi:adenylate cyclase